MATSTETIQVQSKTKYGFKAADGTMYGISKYGTEAGVTPDSFTPGSTIVAKIYMSDSGKKYITAAPTTLNAAEAPKASATTTTKAATAVATTPTKYGRAMSAYDQETDIRIHVSGIVQAVISSPIVAMIPNIEKPEVFAARLEELAHAALLVAGKLVNEKLGK